MEIQNLYLKSLSIQHKSITLAKSFEKEKTKKGDFYLGAHR
jgi:hypothetical protein